MYIQPYKMQGNEKIDFVSRKMANPIDVPKSTFHSVKKSFSVFANFIITWFRSREESDVVCKNYQCSRDVESSLRGQFYNGFESAAFMECLSDFSQSFASVSHLPLHYDTIKSCLADLRKFSLISTEFQYPNDIEWQNITVENLSDIFRDANLIELNTAFLWASFIKRSDLLSGFLGLGAQLNYYEPNYGLSALHLAAFSGCKEGTEFLLSQEGSDLNVIHKCYTPLHCTAFGDSSETAKLLLEKGANIQALTNDLHNSIESILHCAVRANALGCVKIFCDMGANINQLDSSGRTPIHLAAEQGCTDCLRILVKASGANVNLQTIDKKYTPLHFAAEGQHSDCIEVLLENGACSNICNSRTQTPLHLAAKVHSNDCVTLLLKKGKAAANAQDADQRTPLHLAVSKANRLHCSDIIKTLIRYDANVNVKDKHRFTPLHLSALNELSDCAETLIMCNADITAKCKSGTTALRMICQKMPTCIDAIRKKLDESITFTTSKDFELQLDFTTILQHCHPREITYLKTLVREGQNQLLLHPLCSAFLYLKWRKIRKFYIYRSIFTFIFVSVLSSYVLTGLAKNCYNVSKNVTDSTLLKDRDLCFNHSLSGKIIIDSPFLIELQWYVLVILCTGILIRKMCSISGYSSIKQYLCNLENALDWGCVSTVYLISFVYTGRTYVWQNHVSAFGVLLGWINLLYVLGQFPVFGTYVAMYTSVQSEFAKLLFVFSLLLIGFTVSFCVLFPESEVFSNIFIGYIAVLVMTIGEMNFDLIADGNNPDSPFVLDGSKQIIYVIFVTSVTIILLNLLVGIAVHDIQGLRKSAKLSKLVKQAKLILHIEKAIFNDYFHKKIWLELFKWTSLVSVKGHGVLTVKPLHQGEKKLPKDILLAAYEVARKQKKKNKSKGQQMTYPKKKVLKNSRYDDVIGSDFNKLKNNIHYLNIQVVNIKNAVENNQRLMEQILQAIIKSNNNN